MADIQAAWGIDIGQAGLKAIRLKYAEASKQVLAVAFDYVPHPKILSQPDAIPDELINQALERFLSRNDLKGDRVAISVPGQTALTRFIQLPPVEPAKIAEIVKYEARQQIPFALEDVCWQWQTLGGGTEESGFMMEAEVGLFAMKRDQVMQHLKPFTDHQVEVDCIQISPLALYNFLAYDRLGVRPDEAVPATDEHTIVLDMGADNTTLMVSNGQKIWIRNVPIGGNHFTRALTKEMKLTFAKAEHLKINATKAPDPRAVFQALRPVFNDYVSEIQRSIGYFSSVNRNARIAKVIGLGNGFKLAGLQKFLQQNLQYEVERVDSFQGLVGDSVLNAKMFDENRLSFAVPYGLALQGLELTRIHVDLLPEEIRTERIIRSKKPWAVTAAATLLAACSLASFGYARMNDSVSKELYGTSEEKAKNVASEAGTLKSNYQAQEAAFQAQDDKDKKLIPPAGGRVDWLEMRKACLTALPRDKPGQFKDNEILKKNRIRLVSMTAKKYSDLSTWWKGVVAKSKNIKGFLRPEDAENAPAGEGFVVSLKLVHYHKEVDDKGNEIPQKSGTVWVRETFVKNLQKYRVHQQYPISTGEVPVREIGITHPVLVDFGSLGEEFPYYTSPKALKAAQQVGPANGGNVNGKLGAPGLPGNGFRGTTPMPKDGQAKTKTKALVKGVDYVMIPKTECTVQFVWKPVPREKREVFGPLYEFFNRNPQGDFAAAQTFVNAALKKSGSTQTLTQELFDEFKKLHHYTKPAAGG